MTRLEISPMRQGSIPTVPLAACISLRTSEHHRMKVTFGLLLIILGGCASSGPVEIGMSERAWRRATEGEQLIGKADNGETVWSAGSSYYQFRDKKLFRISGGEQRVQVSVE